MLPAAGDGCPFDAAGTSSDGDDLPEACDPFPGRAGDRLRCYMSFTNTDVNDQLWRPRETPARWSSSVGELVGALTAMPTSYVSTLDLERAPQTTYEAFMVGSNASPSGIYAMRMWARARDAFDTNDLGCELSGDAMSTRMAIVRGNDADIAARTELRSFPKSVPMRIAMTLAADATGMNVRCKFTWSTGQVFVVQQRVADVPAGRLAVGAENLQVSVSALAIYERAEAEPLP